MKLHEIVTLMEMLYHIVNGKSGFIDYGVQDGGVWVRVESKHGDEDAFFFKLDEVKS